MSNSKKPGDETIRGLPPFAKSSDSFVGPASATTSRAGNKVTGEVAPEANQGAWRERVFTPRGIMPKQELLQGLEGVVRVVLTKANHPRFAFDQVRESWLPFLRQALEQAGGDGLDVWLVTILKASARKPMDPLFSELVASFARMRSSRDLAQFEEESLKTVELVRKVLGFAQPRRLSFKQLERELEGKVEVDELFTIATSSDEEIGRRIVEIGNTMEQLKDQIQTRPGKQPGGMYSNFVRLKAELRVLDAEAKHRATRTQGQP